jgi:hypothetical protein
VHLDLVLVWKDLGSREAITLVRTS